MVIFIGMMIPHPSTAMVINIFLHIRKNRRKMVASKPTCKMMSFSDVLRTGVTQAKIPLPRGGGACFSSACLSFGA